MLASNLTLILLGCISALSSIGFDGSEKTTMMERRGGGGEERGKKSMRLSRFHAKMYNNCFNHDFCIIEQPSGQKVRTQQCMSHAN